MGNHSAPHCRNSKIREDILKQVNMEKGIIRHLCSPYTSSLVMARKSDASWSFCVNYRTLDSYTVLESHLISQIDVF